MEKVSFKNMKGLELVGDLYSADSKKIIIMCHGLLGDRSEWGRFDRCAEKLNSKGFNILNFDFSGSGESSDTTITIEKEIEDLKSTVDYVLGKGYEKIGFLGFGLGGYICLKNYSEKISTICLWAPATDKREDFEKMFTEEELDELEKEEVITTIMEEGVREEIVIDKKMFEEVKEIDQEELLKEVKCSVLILHGDEDETVEVEESKKAIRMLSSDSKLEVAHGANHGIYEHLDAFINKSVEWFMQNL